MNLGDSNHPPSTPNYNDSNIEHQQKYSPNYLPHQLQPLQQSQFVPEPYTTSISSNPNAYPYIKQEPIDLSNQVYPSFYQQPPIHHQSPPPQQQLGNEIIQHSFQFQYEIPPQQTLAPIQPPILESTQSPIVPKPTPRRKKHKQFNTNDSQVSTSGENELKQLAMQQCNVPLIELASRIKQLENEVPQQSPMEHSKMKEQKETQRSLFGMVWLFNSCESSPTAVIPRNRIYARYVQICADNSISPLSPASFGKLVKILYPGITTRRLGMRGQSKYHYCGVKLKGDQSINQGHQLSPQLLALQQPQPQLASGFTVNSPVSSTNSSVSYEDSPISLSRAHTPSYTPINSPSITTTTTTDSLIDQLPSIAHLKHIPSIFILLSNNQVSPESNPYLPIKLPSIYPYLTKDVDYDIADTLYSLYKVHINSLFESLRFMQVKKLLSCFVNFNNILTAPVLKLYCQDSMIEWVKKCDLIMYKKMIRMLAKLQLQFFVPLDQLKLISSNYIKTLSNSLINSKVSKNFIIMKLKLAKHFINLLNRLIKVIETGQSASRILNDKSDRTAMVKDWTNLDLNELILREIPCNDKNIDTLTYIMNYEVGNLLCIENNGEFTMQSLANYLANLPGRFPNVNPRLLLLLASNLLTACLKEISLFGGEGFGAWWIVRCWIDEYLAWTIELGGFFKDDLKEFTNQQLENHNLEQNEGYTNFGSIDLLDTSFEDKN